MTWCPTDVLEVGRRLDLCRAAAWRFRHGTFGDVPFPISVYSSLVGVKRSNQPRTKHLLVVLVRIAIAVILPPFDKLDIYY